MPTNMSTICQISAEPIIELLRRSAQGRSKQLDDLMVELHPQFLLDSETERILFRASRHPNAITVGLNCTCRLQAHAYAFGITLAALGTPGYLEMASEVRARLYDSANPLLKWAVSRDLREWTGHRLNLETIFRGEGVELPEGLLGSLNERQRLFGQGLFHLASAFILLHELAHLHCGHVECTGVESHQQEKDADWFAADWLVNSPKVSQTHRLNCLYGIAVALLWETVFNVFLGLRQSNTHPEGYDRLFQTLDRAIDPTDEHEGNLVWELVSRILFAHLGAAGIEINTASPDSSPRGWVNYLIDIISKKSQW